MSVAAEHVPEMRTDVPVLLLSAAAVLGISLLLQQDLSARHAVLFLIAAAMGMTLHHAAFGFTGGWQAMIGERRSAGVRGHILLLGLTSVLFLPVLAGMFPGLHAQPALAPAGVSVLVGAFLFGIGMQLGGGCGSGTLYTVGGGHVRMLITLACFVAGSLIGTAHLHWWLALPDLGSVSLLKSLGWLPALLLQLTLLAALYGAGRAVERHRHGSVERLGAGASASAPLAVRLRRGPWPLWWGAAALAVLGLLTLLVAGHPWSITFAFGLWGAKIWQALGGSVGDWPYWSSGYPAEALNHSVLADVTSVMDFGIVLGAVLAAGLAGNFAPEERVPWRKVLASVIGGLLLGYGARLAFGCNIGGLLAGIGSGSLHGWLWLVAGFAGAVVGVRLRAAVQLDRPVEANA